MGVDLIRGEFGEHEWVRELERHNVRFVEQLGGLLSTPKGRMALDHLGVSPPNIAAVQKKVDRRLLKLHHASFGTAKAVSPLTGFIFQPRMSHGLGLRLPSVLKDADFGDILPTATALATLGPSPATSTWPDSAPPPASGPGGTAPPPTLPPSVDLKPILTPVRDQFYRGTCVAFTATALLEAQVLRDTHQVLDLSEQFVYYLARQNDPDRREDGTYLQYALDGLQQRGACLAGLWPYSHYNDWGQALTFLPPAHPLVDLEADARSHRIAGYSGCRANDVNAMKFALAHNQPVAVGLPVFKDAWINAFTNSTGEVQMPLARPNPDGTETLLDTVTGGHAIPLIGYRDTPDPNDVAVHRPGGGYFTFKNSWGTAWASGNLNDGPGFGILPYAYLEKYNTAAYVIR